MALYVEKNHDLFLKLSTTSMAIKTTLVKLFAHQKSILEENKKDREHYQMYLAAYSESEEDLHYADLFMNVSSEVDHLLMETESKNDR
ncbi:hypothetical protein P4T04_05070 [Bacillus badius]|uniref:hypothetical protein n=1 Tax=Bacillus badius TaxID=1455 RepID=UPI002E1CB57D|nr:hypothetical protein [Bacillus badius]